jgi:phage terminase large subunit-like protein
MRMKEAASNLDSLQRLRDWAFWARPGQTEPPGDWRTWLILAGRGFGKTRAGAEWVREQVRRGAGRIALVAPTMADARDIMVRGESGLLSVCWKGDVTHAGRVTGRPHYVASRRRLVWKNGAQAMLFSAEEPERLRGPQHDALWADELCAWRHARETWDMAMFGLRLGADPRACVTTTPKPLKLIKELADDPATAVTRGTTFDNANNLAPGFIASVQAKYGETTLGRQELMGELLAEREGALWSRARLDAQRRATPADLRRIVVAVDPPAASKESSDACGIVAAGLSPDGKAHVIADASIRAAKPVAWAARAVALYETLGADLMLAEVNQGGDMVEAVIRQVEPDVALKKVHATRNKRMRAEPVAALYEQQRVTHAPGLDALEDEMCVFGPDGLASGHSPDRLDALVWAISELMLNRRGEPRVRGL